MKYLFALLLKYSVSNFHFVEDGQDIGFAVILRSSSGLGVGQFTNPAHDE